MRIMSLRAFSRAAPELAEPVLVTHGGRTIGRFEPEAPAAMPDASTRQVAAVAGVSDTTVWRSRQGASNEAPVTGADGKTYPRVLREVKAQPVAPGHGFGRSRPAPKPGR
jgi:hypothetical protein